MQPGEPGASYLTALCQWPDKYADISRNKLASKMDLSQARMSTLLQNSNTWRANDTMHKHALRIIEVCGGTPEDLERWTQYHLQVVAYQVTGEQPLPKPPDPSWQAGTAPPNVPRAELPSSGRRRVALGILVLLLASLVVIMPSASAPIPRNTPSSRSSLDILSVGHSFTSGIERLTITVRNTSTERVFVKEIDIYTDRGPQRWHGGDTDEWHFLVPGEMNPGTSANDGSRRTHGMIGMNGAEFEIPLIGEGWVEPHGAWRRLLTFNPQKFMPGSSTMSIVVDIPTTVLLQMTSANEPAGPMVEQKFDYTIGALFTYVEVTTPDHRTFGCDYVGTDKPPCRPFDLDAAVALPDR